MDPAVPFILMLTIAIIIRILFVFLLAALHGRPESKGSGHALNALYVGTPLARE